MRSCVALVVLAVACGQRDRTAPASTPTTEAPPGTDGSAAAAETRGCEALPFAETTPLPEASGAAWLTLDGERVLVVVADSGHRGAYAVIDPDTGATRSQGTLPLGSSASDDLEGLAAHGDRLYGLTSGGYLRVWEWSVDGFSLVDGPYPIGGADFVCADPQRTNCNRDYEGLALAPAATPGACAGFACARADGALDCLVWRDGKLAVDPTRRIATAISGKALADCAFSPEGRLYTGSNLFGLAKVHRIDGWAEPPSGASARVVEIEALPSGFPEVIAVEGDIIYRMSDLGGTTPSLMAKFRCPAATR